MKPPVSPARTLKRPGEIAAPAPDAVATTEVVKPAPRHPDGGAGAFVSVPARRLRRPGEIAAPAAPDVPKEPTRHETGLSAESRAAAFLVSRGFRIVARRVRTPRGELDIVATKGSLIVFAEVKARSSADRAAESLSAAQQKRLVAAAELFLAKQTVDMTRVEVRFDVLLVAPGRPPVHLPGAFRAE
jgi:putative endonuclease